MEALNIEQLVGYSGIILLLFTGLMKALSKIEKQEAAIAKLHADNSALHESKVEVLAATLTAQNESVRTLERAMELVQ